MVPSWEEEERRRRRRLVEEEKERKKPRPGRRTSTTGLLPGAIRSCLRPGARGILFPFQLLAKTGGKYFQAEKKLNVFFLLG